MRSSRSLALVALVPLVGIIVLPAPLLDAATLWLCHHAAAATWTLALTAAATALLVVAGALPSAPWRTPTTAVMCLAALMVAIVGFATRTAVDGEGALFGLLPYVVGFGAGAIVFAVRPPDALVRSLLVGAALVMALSVVADSLGAWPLAGARRPGGLAGNRNAAAVLLALMLPIVIDRLRGRRARLVYVPLIALALALTRCRAAWLGAIVATAVVVAGTRPRAYDVVALLLAGALAAVVMPTRLAWRDPAPYRSSLVHLVDAEGSGMARLEQHRAAAAALSAQHAWWRGFGAGRWRAIVDARDGRAVNMLPSSDYVRAAVDGGAPLLAVVVALYAALLVAAWRRRDASLAAVVVVLAVAGGFDAVAARPAAAIVVALAAASLAPALAERRADAPASVAQAA